MSRPKVWATLITNAGYIPGWCSSRHAIVEYSLIRALGLLVMHRTLVSVSKHQLIVLATDSLTASSRHAIEGAGITIHDIETLLPRKGHIGFNPTFDRFTDVWTKLRVFGLTEYERIIMIDSDMLFLRPMDELFDLDLPGLDWIGAAPACLCNPLKLDYYPKDW